MFFKDKRGRHDLSQKKNAPDNHRRRAKIRSGYTLACKRQEMRLDAAAAAGWTYLSLILAKKKKKTALFPTAVDNYDVLTTW